MRAQITIRGMIPEPEVFPNDGCKDPYKTCPYCGQNRIPFKKGICICGTQVGNIVYVNNTAKIAKCQYYSYVGISKVEKLGITELTDN